MANGGLLAQDAQADPKAEEAPAPADDGVPRMTAEVLRECCLSNQGYAAPELNEVLVLHYKGFRKIEGLNAYTEVRSLFLECNGIRKLENLEVMPHLVSLYLQSNCITAIENLEALTQLKYLNLSNNGITSVSGLALMPCLETINLAANKIADVDALRGLAERPSLKSVDVSCNYVEDGDAFLDFWPQHLPEVECLYLHHNSCSRFLKDYRRRLVSSLPKLRWADERPVTALERVGCEAWATGGKEAELEAKRVHHQNEQDEKRRSLANFRLLQQAAAERARAQREAQAARDAARNRAADALRHTGALEEGWVTLPSGGPAAGSQPSAAEPSRQQELRSKVEAFFARPEREAAQAESGNAAAEPMPAVASASAQQEEAEDSGRGEAAQAESGNSAAEPMPVVASASAQQEESEDSGPSPVQEAPAEEPAEAGPFAWSNFRDKRLGRLVADFRYNFRKAAEALGKEFGCSVSEQECRQRYGELTRPSRPAPNGGPQPRVVPADRGRARDAPEPDAAAVREVSDWWLRRISRGPREPESRASVPPGSAGGASARAEREAEVEGPALPELAAAVPISPLAGLLGAEGSSASQEDVASLAVPAAQSEEAASRQTTLAFAPPPRQPKSTELFELD